MAGSACIGVLVFESREEGAAGMLLSAQEGFSVAYGDLSAGSGRLSAASGFDLILVDLSGSQSPAMDDFRRARALAPGVPAVVIGREEDRGLAESVLTQGAQDFLAREGLDGHNLARALHQALIRARAHARFLRDRFDAIPVGVMLVSGRKVAMANRAAQALLGGSEADLASLSVLDFFPDEAHPLLQGALDSSAGPAPEARFEAGLGRPGKTPADCLVLVSGGLLNDAPAVALYLIPNAHAGERSQGSLRVHAEKMTALKRLAGVLAHDFNNLLTAINGYSDHLLGMTGSEGPMASGLQAIRRAGETAAAMTRSLAIFGHPGGSEMRAVRLDDALRESAPMLEEFLGPSIDLRLRLDAGSAAVRLEPGQLEKLVLVLAANARDAMPRGGTLTLATATEDIGPGYIFSHLASREGPNVSIMVEDTGGGMGPEIMECLFEPFFTTKGGGRGTGLGLANLYGIVSRSCGGISVASAPGKGSRFTIHLAQDASRIRADSPRPAAAWSAGGARPDETGSEGGTVLVVEDEPSLREMIGAILKRYGFGVLTANSAEDALETAGNRASEVDLVLTDVMLRGGEGGHELALSLQAIKPGLRTIFISGHPLEILAERGIVIPAEAFLEKPFSPSQLAAKVRRVLDAARNPS